MHYDVEITPGVHTVGNYHKHVHLAAQVQNMSPHNSDQQIQTKYLLKTSLDANIIKKKVHKVNS